VEENDEYRPAEQFGFRAEGLSPEEKLAMSGRLEGATPEGDDLVPMEDAW
jgi:hypothetical protein